MKQQVKRTPDNIREIRIVTPEKPRHGLTRKYTFNAKPKLVDFLPWCEFYIFCREAGILNLCRMTKSEMCCSLNIKMKPAPKRVYVKKKIIPVHTCSEEPRKIDLCCVRVLRAMARKEGVSYWSKMQKHQLLTALNVEFKK